MSLKSLPEELEKRVDRFAVEHKLSHDTAILRLIENGLNAEEGGVANDSLHSGLIPGLPDEPLSEEDARIVDEALELVMEARQERSERMFGA